jgi:hypothetical protein
MKNAKRGVRGVIMLIAWRLSNRFHQKIYCQSMEILKRTSVDDPILPTNGRVIRLGTKKTGSHLANNVAPGLSSRNRFGPTGNVNIVANRRQQPAKEDGKEIASARNNFRKATSKAINRDADRNGLSGFE